MLHTNNKLLVFFGCSLLGLLLFVYGHQVRASTVDDLQNKIRSTNDQIQKLEAEIKQYEQSLGKTTEKAKSLQNEVNALNLSKKKLETELKVTEANIQKTSANISLLKNRIGTTEGNIREKKSLIASSIRDLHDEENSSVIEILLSSQNLSEVSRSFEHAIKFNDSVTSLIQELRQEENILSTQKSTQEGKKTELTKLQSSLSGQKKAVNDTALQTTKVLTETKNQESNYQKILAEKVKQRQEFEQELFKYESELKIAIDPSKLPSLGSRPLSWPLTSVYITQLFGKTTTSGRLYASGTHNGIDLRATDGTKVKAALSGTVQATGNTDLKANCYSYGKWILLKHNNGLSTLYAHLSSIAVSPGDSIVTGDVIGYSGRTGYVTGPHLHLTVFASEGVRVMEYPKDKAINCGGVTIPIADPKAFLDPLLYLPTL